LKVKFLCGCKTGNIESRVNLLTMDSVDIDEDGMLVCAVHNVRRSGWRSIPGSVNHPGSKTPYFGLTPTEIEGRIVLKDPFPLPRPLNIIFANVPDMRDNRDPQQVGMEHLKQRGILH
jgi:hypothetical protein